MPGWNECFEGGELFLLAEIPHVTGYFCKEGVENDIKASRKEYKAVTLYEMSSN